MRSALRSICISQGQLLGVIETINVAEMIDEIILSIDKDAIHVVSLSETNKSEVLQAVKPRTKRPPVTAVGPPAFLASQMVSANRAHQVSRIASHLVDGGNQVLDLSVEDLIVHRLLLNGVPQETICLCSTASQLHALEALVLPSLDSDDGD